MQTLNVYSIFKSIDGEANGFYGAGQPAYFIRLWGCNLNCKWCDTVYAQQVSNEISTKLYSPIGRMDIDSIAEKIPSGAKVTITGGEPLLQKEGLENLIFKLLEKSCKISIETNGSVELPQRLQSIHSVRFIVDYKLPSSGMTEKMKSSIFCNLQDRHVVKMVVEDLRDYEEAKKVIKTLRKTLRCKALIALSPVLTGLTQKGPMEVFTKWPAQLAEMIVKDNLDEYNVVFSLQIHKILWPGSQEER